MAANPGVVQRPEPLRVEAVESFSRLMRLRTDWEALHAADPQATVFTSWAWMRGWLEAARRWLVLRVHGTRSGATRALAVFERPQDDVLQIGGTPLADHAGFLCAPGFETHALSALGEHLLASRAWRRIKLRDMLEPRMEAFLSPFRRAGRRYEVEEGGATPCPYLTLPESWETYRSRSLNKKARNKLNRVTRKLEALPGFRAVPGTPERYPEQLAILLQLWQQRWGGRSQAELARLRAIFDSCRDAGQLWLLTLHQNEAPIAASLGFLDRAHGTFSGYIGAYAPEYAGYSPGTAIVGMAVRDAIDRGLRTFDFLRGAEQYKYETFRASTRYNTDVTVKRLGLRRALGRSLRGCLRTSG